MPDKDTSTTTAAGDEVAADRLRQFIERIERLEEDKAAIAEDIKDVYGEAKGEGYDTKVMRRLISDRKKEPQEVQEFQMLLDLYGTAIGEMPTKKQQVKDALH